MHQRAYLLAGDDLLQIAHGVHVEDDDGQVVFLAHTGGCEVHDAQVAAEHFVIGDVGELRGRRVFLRISRINAVHARALEHHVGLNLDAAQR